MAASSTPPGLLTLPTEIRLQIWEYALTSDTGTLVYDFQKRRFDVSSIGAGIISTCHAAAFDTMFLPLKLNTLVFDVPLHITVDSMVFLERLSRLEEELGWMFKKDVRYSGYIIDERGWLRPRTGPTPFMW